MGWILRVRIWMVAIALGLCGAGEARAQGERSPGLRAYWSYGQSDCDRLGHVDWARYDATSIEGQINWDLTGDPFVTDGPTDYFALRLAGKLEIPRSGSWTFGLGSDESARLIINGVTVVNDDTAHGFRWKDGVLTLAAGQHDIEVLYLERRYSAGLVLTWHGPGDAVEEVIPAEAFVAEAPAGGAGGDGLRAYWSENLSHAQKVGHVDWEQQDAVTTVDNVGWRLTSGEFREGGATDYFAVRLVGRVAVPSDGSWTFSVGADESVALYINGSPVVYDTTAHSFRWASGTLTLTAGTHDIEIWFLERRYSAGLFLTWMGPGVPAESVIPASAFSLQETEQPFEPGGGLRAYWSGGVSHAVNVGQIDWAEHDSTSVIQKVSWKLTNGPCEVDGDSDYFAMRAVGLIDIPESGTWTLSLGSDESAQLYIDGQLVASDHVAHSFRWLSGNVTLTEGLHSFEIRYLERRYSAGLVATWEGPGHPFATIIPAAAFSLHPEDPVVDAGEPAITARWVEGVVGDAETVDFSGGSVSTAEHRVSWRTTNAAFRTDGATDYFGVRLTGRLSVPRDGSWTFNVGSDESAILTIGGETVVRDSARHSYRWVGGAIDLEAGEHDLELVFVEQRYRAGLFLTWQGPGDVCESVIPASAFVPRRGSRVVRWREVSSFEE